MFTFKSCAITLFLLTLLSGLATNIFADDRPNILLIVSEDNGPELGCYGDKYAQTPNLDRFALQGVRFETAYVTQAVCSPSRGTIFTGLYPHQNGQIGLATHQFAMFREWPTTYSILKQAGYRTGLLGKTHVNPESVIEKWVDFRAIRSANFAKKNLQDYSKKSAEFINASDKPFFLTVNFPDAHWPVQNQVQGRPQKVLSPSDVGPMPYIGFNNQRLNGHLTGFYNCMSRLDECVGELLDALEKSGKAENTLVIYIGDHGAQFARGKVFVTEGGLRIPFMVRWPGKAKPGLVSNQMISTVDLLPTIVSAAGAKIPEGLPGFNLAPVLKGESNRLRNYLFGERNSDAATFHFPQRTVRDTRFKLIKSLLPDQRDPAAHHCLVNGASNFRGSPTYEELKATGSKQTQQAYATWLTPPLYQLYDLENDPHEFVNLADDPKLANVRDRLINRLEQWQVETDDKLRIPELLDKLTAEIQFCLKNKIRSPNGGWKYINYLATDRATDLEQENQIPADVKKIWDAAPHNAFTDLIRWNDKFYCAFRTGTGHVPGATGEDGKIQVIGSTDGMSWSSAAEVIEPGIDLRDPKLSITPDDRLMLLMGGSNYDGKTLVDCAPRVAFMAKGDKQFSKTQTLNIDSQISSKNDWLWRVTWHKGIGYGVVYQAQNTPWGLHLVSTHDGINYELVHTFAAKGKPNESTIRFDSFDQMHLVIRNEDGRRIGHYGRSKAPFADWQWNPIKRRLGGPDLIQLPNGEWLLGTREYGKSATTVLGTLSDDGTFKKLIDFPSDGDTSYPGMLIQGDELWVSYYSSHEGRTSIYLARIPLAGLMPTNSGTHQQPGPTTVFEQRDIPAGVPLEGHGKDAKKYGYRIPSLLVTNKGTTLAFAERRIGLHDHAQNDIVLKRSTDGGKTWGDEIVAVEDGMNSINDPLTVQLANGRILLMFGRFPYGRHARTSGWIKMADLGYDDPKSNVLTFICHSDDDGLTWSKPVDISRQVKAPNLLNANTPGAMIQLTTGPHKGRVVTGLWGTVPIVKQGKESREWQIVVAFSDDHGKSWTRTDPIKDISGKGFPNECQVAEAANGDLVLISRNQGGDTYRKKTISHDGGASWEPLDIDKSLPSVACMGSVIKGPTKPDGTWDLYASFPSNKGRKDGQIAISKDNGATWEIAKVIKGAFAYSATQIAADKKRLLCLYEGSGYKKIILLKIPLSELAKGSD